MKFMLISYATNSSSNNGYFKVLFLQRTHSPFILKNGVNIELGKTNRLNALYMMQNNA